MAASIVYEGAGGGGGTLFEGKKFWVAQRIPSRLHYIGLLQSNGGTIVPLEKNADILIADHAIKNPPPGSYSWKYIEDSVKNGRLENLEDHRAAGPAGMVRPIGASRPGQAMKQTRTPFTPEDDRILMNWVMLAERRGASIKGNIIYQELASANPRHTSQSWRDRWVKVVQFYKRPEINSDVIDAAGSATPPVARAVSNGQVRNAPGPAPASDMVPVSRRRKLLVHEVKEKSPSPPAPEVPTFEDYKLLKDAFDDICNLDVNRTEDAWAAWANEYPQHSAEYWQRLWHEDVFPTVARSRERKALKAKTEKEALLQSRPVSETSSSRPTIHRVFYPSPAGEPSRTNHPIGTPTKITSRPAIPPKKSSASVDDEELNFRRDLKAFEEHTGLRVNTRPTICGKTISLYQLWQVVFRQDFTGFDAVESANRWPQVATKMGFNTFRVPKVPNELRALYQDQLADYEDSIRKFEALEEQAANDESSDWDERDSEEEHNEDDDNLDIPSSAPRPASKKRSSIDESDLFVSPEPAKRHKPDKGKQKATQEIPSTPEHRYSTTFRNQSPVLDDIDDNRLYPEDDAFQTQPPLYPFLSSALEPETQDFTYNQTATQPGRDLTSPSPSPASPLSPSEQILEESSEAALPVYPKLQSPSRSPSPPIGDDSSTQSQTESQREAVLEAFIEDRKSQGIPNDIVIEALQDTTMDTTNVDVVIAALLNHEALPDDVAGVWTTEDDALLLSKEGSENMLRKHGEDRYRSRLLYLRTMESVQQ